MLLVFNSNIRCIEMMDFQSQEASILRLIVTLDVLKFCYSALLSACVLAFNSNIRCIEIIEEQNQLHYQLCLISTLDLLKCNFYEFKNRIFVSLITT